MISQKKKKLVVEDNRINIAFKKTTKSILPGCTILEASDGKKAIKLYKKEARFDLDGHSNAHKKWIWGNC
jgi:CheY-like chemotaxis protein